MDNYMTKQEYLDKDAKTRKSIERQKSLELAITLAIKTELSNDNIIAHAKRFEKYLADGE